MQWHKALQRHSCLEEVAAGGKEEGSNTDLPSKRTGQAQAQVRAGLMRPGAPNTPAVCL